MTLINSAAFNKGENKYKTSLYDFARHIQRKRLIFLCMMCLCSCLKGLSANMPLPFLQEDSLGTMLDTATVKKVPFKNKIGFRTNVIDWLFTIPNVGVELEVGKSKYYRNPYTISLVGRYNWNTHHDYLPSMVFNLADIRIEGRKYWRTRSIWNNAYEKELDSVSRSSRMKYLWRQAFRLERLQPNLERGYYAGVYLGYHNYSFKFGLTGYQGYAFSGGVTGGFTIPFYTYKNHSIDLDLGGSFGLFYTNYDTYRYDAESNCYPKVSIGKKTFLPMVTEVRVALVYRFESVRKKELTNLFGYEERKNYLEDRARDKYREYRADSLHRDSLKKEKVLLREAKRLADSLEDVRTKFSRDSLRRVEFVADSLADLRRDSLRQVAEFEDSIKHLQNEANKDSIRQEKKRRREEKKSRKKKKEEQVMPESSDTLSVYRQPMIDDRILAVRFNKKED